MKKLTAKFGKTKIIWRNLILSIFCILLFSTNSMAHDTGISSINIKLNSNQLIVHSTYARNDFETQDIKNLAKKAFIFEAKGKILVPTKTEFTENGHEANFKHFLETVSDSDLTIRSLLPPSLSPNHQQVLTILRGNGKEIVHQTLQGNYQFTIKAKELQAQKLSSFLAMLIFASLGICLALLRINTRKKETSNMTKALLTLANIGVLILIVIYAIYNQNNQVVEANADKSKVKITEKDGFRHITSNGIPNHKTGEFPNNGNPNRIRSQKHKFKVTLKPTIAKDKELFPRRARRDRNDRNDRRPPAPPSLFGVALNGIPFDPGTAEAWQNDRRSGWNNEALTGKLNLGIDMNNAHVQPTGAYHYHGIPKGFVQKLAGKEVGKKMVLVGYAADGFPVYSQYGYAKANNAKSEVKKMLSSYRLKEGIRPSGPGKKYDGTYLQDFEFVKDLGDLDECNGRSGITPEYPKGIYHYYLTDTFPFVPRCHRGIADKSFQKKPPRRGLFGRPPRDGRRPPPRRPF